MSEERLRKRLREAEVPDPDHAEEHSWRVVEAAFAERARQRDQLRLGHRAPARIPPRLALAVAAVGALILALALTPAGAAVREWVADAIDEGARTQHRALTELPAPGQLLVASRPGIWLVREDGTRRLLGDYEEASFSPRGLNVVATRGAQLVAVDPEGELQWSISRDHPIADARWAPSGYRVAFRDGDALGVIAGDGTAPRELVEAVAPIAPSWRPSPAGVDPRYAPNVVTYADPRGRITTLDVDSGERLWRTAPGPQPRSVEWVDSDRLVVATDRSVRLLDGAGRPQREVSLPGRGRVESVAPSPDGDRLAIVLGPPRGPLGGQSELLLERIGHGAQEQRSLFSGLGRFGAPVFSPDGKWILLPWADTDQWFFISSSGDRKLVRHTTAVTDVARQFDPGGRGTAAFPTVGSWCCS